MMNAGNGLGFENSTFPESFKEPIYLRNSINSPKSPHQQPNCNIVFQATRDNHLAAFEKLILMQSLV